MIKIPSRSTVALAGGMLAAITAFAASPTLAADGVATLGSPPPEEEQGAVATSVEDPMDAMLEFAACMRENGIDMPDPQGTGGVFTMTFDGPVSGDADDPMGLDDTFLAAEEACGGLLGAMDSAADPALDAELMEGLLAHAECMRENGIDMPDPVMQDGGFMLGATVAEGTSDDTDFFSDEFMAAEEACREVMSFPEFGATGEATP